MFYLQKIGEFLPTDEEGWIVNPCRGDRLQSLWLDLIEDLKELCRERFGDNLRSLYIRGSVARGCAIAGISDLDGFAILYEELGDGEDKWTASTQRLLKLKYPFCAGVEIGIIPYQNFLKTHHLKVLLKTQSLCILGEDLGRSLPSYILPSYKPGIDFVRQALLLPNFLKGSEEKLRKLDPKSISFTTEVKQISAVIGKRMVRGGMELVVERSRQYTRDLYLCYESFSSYYPEQKLNMKKALELAIAPSANRAGLLIFINLFGSWLVSEIEAKLECKSALKRTK